MAAAPSNSEVRPLHALLVEDDHVARMVIEKMLKDSTWTVTVADDGLQALQFLGLQEENASGYEDVKKNLDMVITDFNVPHVNGCELLKKIKHNSSIFKEIPVVVISADTDQARIKSCMEVGAAKFLPKPIEMVAIKSFAEMVHNHP